MLRYGVLKKQLQGSTSVELRISRLSSRQLNYAILGSRESDHFGQQPQVGYPSCDLGLGALVQVFCLLDAHH